MNPCFIYCRVSTEEQVETGYSLDTQEHICRDFASRNDFSIVDVFRDEGKSGTKLNRPALQDMLSRCKSRSISAIIVQETDRLARNANDHLTIKALLKRSGVKVISVSQPMLDDSPEGMMIDTILASVNQFQSDINGRKTKRGMQEKIELGWYPRWAPLGYINTTQDDESGMGRVSKIVEPDPKTSLLVRKCFDLYLTGTHSVSEINDILNGEGLRSKHNKKMAHSVLVKMLKNPFYAGWLNWNGSIYQGKHQPLITLAEHNRILEIMSVHNHHVSRRRLHDFLLRGFVFCNICGTRYTGEKHPNKKKDYYHCGANGVHSNRFQNVPVKELECLVAECFRSIRFDSRFLELLRDKLVILARTQRKDHKVLVEELQSQKAIIESQRDKAEEKLLQGVLTNEDYSRIRRRHHEEIMVCDQKIQAATQKREVDRDTLQLFLSICMDLYGTYTIAPYEVKRGLLAVFFDKIFVENRKIVTVQPTEITRALQDESMVILRKAWQPSDALVRTLLDHEYMEQLATHIEIITRWLDQKATKGEDPT